MRGFLGVKKVYLQTFGCQMNERDSEGVKGLLLRDGYALTDEMGDAQVILLNTCSVREHAEDRIFGRSGLLSKMKQKNPGILVGVMGCMAQEHGAKFFKRMPSLDLVCGPGNLSEIPALLARIGQNGEKVTAIDRINDMEYSMGGIVHRDHAVKTAVNIMSGCDHKCTYCIVPQTRGIERSRPSEHIVDEIKGLVDRGFKEFLLLGQNVNCYGKKLDEDIDFADLLYKIDKVAPDARVRFTTSHPKDAHTRLFQAMKDLPSVCEHLHLPVQSGSSRVLKRMKREHTREWYLERIHEFKALMPEGDISTDLITGFCGESDEDHRDTLSLMEEVSFASAYIFKYSERPNTPASRLEDDVPEEVKSKRHQELLELQRRLSLTQYSRHLDKTVEVLIEDYRPEENNRAFGRTRDFKRVVVNSAEDIRGQVHPVKIKQVLSETLLGDIV